ncbi:MULTISPECIES: hypothetical protein [Bacillus]|uniref:Uncharacterized protein n=1 Tax=Bacillus glycinifermentans TaxID=1664069 RepID=A0AAJ4D0X5_9BACI|nr:MULTISPECIES: hypothetical protein [Bacillus]KKB75515.1 hypothetical protein TH62_01490 [Bacillus sp. TH008]MBU8785839.1 hypothetical protein [Bacillus glycinifermentans]MDU0071209.1 hypothetical protein [Bacillus sp. IG6]MED8019077.1 hypothetical protein [Bacillus glycinifermentans]NUJ15625.1 hypothetical protein [Bacillus glycinifermentans]
MSQDDILKKLDELSQKIDTLETSLNHRSHPSLFLKMDVKDLHLQELNLEEFAFHLDNIEIKDLSGMLNMGNVFSPYIHPKPKRPPHQKKKRKTDEIEVKINGKAVPYTIN